MTTEVSPEARALADYVDNAAKILHLPIAPEHHAGVLMNFARLAAFAKVVVEKPLAEDEVPAPVFRPGSG